MGLSTEQRNNLKKLSKALKSGDYRQGKSSLHHANRYCCLGVACDISEKGKWKMINGTLEYVCNDYDTNHIYIVTQEIRDLYGFTHEEGVNIYVKDLVKHNHKLKIDEKVLDKIEKEKSCYGNKVNLAGLNDLGVNFEQIAKVIDLIVDDKIWYIEY